MPLSQRFFLVALVVVFGSVVAFGGWTGAYVSDSIVRGVGETAASSIKALVSRALDGVLINGQPNEQDRSDLEAIFDVASGTDNTRLLLLRLHRPDGETVLEIGNELRDETLEANLELAGEGKVSVQLINVVIPGIAGLPSSPLPVIKIYGPLTSNSGDIIGTTELLFGAKAIATLQSQARSAAWIIAALVGFVALGVVAIVVDLFGRIIVAQRRRLATNLARTRELLRDNVALQQASSALRLESLLANERVLNEVGSDIHDGPVQLLTLLILRLPGGDEVAEANRGLAQQSMEELRAISSGLVLPEIDTMSLGQAVEAAIERHQNQTGRSVATRIDVPPDAMGTLPARICAFRVSQEALGNAARHGGGEVESISAQLDGGWLTIRVANPLPAGVDLTVEKGRLGLRGMQLRVESQLGRLDLRASNGQAILEARFPIEEQP
jgi:signal transduction histidine kinase